MLNWLFRRALILIPTWIGITIVAFGLIRLVPGDPILMMLGERGANPEVYAAMRANLGLDLPLWQQYLKFVSQALHGDFGISVVSKLPVIEEFWARFPATLELGFAALTWATLLGIPLGIIAAVNRGSKLDFTVMTVSLVGYSMPIFWWGLILILFFSVQWGITPVSGRIAVEFETPVVTGFLLLDCWLNTAVPFAERMASFVSACRHLVLPAIAMGTIPLAVISRVTRSSMLEVLGEDYIRTAKAKGLTNRRIIGLHALRNAMIPIITTVGLMIGTIVTGAILTETLFSWPGIGKWLVKSVTSRDYPVIQAGILLIASLVVMINFLVDLTYAWANPKLRKR